MILVKHWILLLVVVMRIWPELYLSSIVLGTSISPSNYEVRLILFPGCQSSVVSPPSTTKPHPSTHYSSHPTPYSPL
jgi:hypothetical protein